jgi:putative glycosyltransferase (TIGR04372 family)
MWGRHPDLRINKFAWLLYSANKLLPNSERYEIENTGTIDSKDLVIKSKVHLQFTHDEIKEAQTDLRKMGIPPADSAYIGLIARDSGYLKTVFPERNWDYHNYRDSNIDNYVLAAEELAARGHYVLRMGAAVENPFKTNNPKIIDYAMNGYRTDLLDIYIAANCYFFISTGTGMDEIPVLFRRPVVRVNHMPIEWIRGWLPNEITIFKKHWLKDKKRFMTVREIIESGAGKWTYAELFEEHGIELIENTPEEIRDVITEMENRLKGVWETTEEDEELQKRFWSFFKPGELNPVFRSRIGAEFLRQNKEMLE